MLSEDARRTADGGVELASLDDASKKKQSGRAVGEAASVREQKESGLRGWGCFEMKLIDGRTRARMCSKPLVRCIAP
eukprot:1047756-Pleurochrysis_carterae.AAC.1